MPKYIVKMQSIEKAFGGNKVCMEWTLLAKVALFMPFGRKWYW